MKRYRLLLVALVVLMRQEVHAGKEEADTLAAKAAESFFNAWQQQNLTNVMKVVDVPWCHDGREIITDVQKLRDVFGKAFADSKDLPKNKLHIRKIGKLAEFRKDKKGPPSRKVSLAEVLSKDDLVVFVEIERPNGRLQPTWIGVRLEKGQAKVVGAMD